jgi:hypothetical protein
MVTKCAVCARDFGKTEDVTLYPIWGVTDGFYDARLPKAFFKVPPIKFDKICIQNTGTFGQARERECEATKHAREALRVSFLHPLAVYCGKVTSSCSSNSSLSFAMPRVFGLNSWRLNAKPMSFGESLNISLGHLEKKMRGC